MPQEQSVGSFGERLRREREMRGISLDEIATATKISARNLKALEDEKFDQLPGGIFNKGFVRAYAKFLGIDEEHIVAEYVTASQDTESVREQKLKMEFVKPEFKKDDKEISLEPKSQWGTIAAIVLVAVLVFGGYQVYQKKKAERERQHSSQTVPSSPATLAPATQHPPALQETKPLATSESTPPPQAVAPSAVTAAPNAAQDKNQPV